MALRPRQARVAARATLLLALLLLAGCATYRSEVLHAEPLPDRVLVEGERTELPGTRRAELRARLVIDGGRERLQLEEVLTADFVTERRVASRTAETRHAVVRSDMLDVNDGYHPFWVFPHSTAYVASNDDVALGVVSYVFALPLVTWTDLLADVVSLPYHTLQMILHERDRVVLGEPRDAPLVERGVVLATAALAGEVDAVRVHRGDATTLLPERDAHGELVLDAAELLPLDQPLHDELEVSFLHGGVARRLPVELPAQWQALRRAERGFDAEADPGRGRPAARVSLHLPTTLRAGDAAFLALDVANAGTGDFLDLVAELRSPHPHLNGRQLPLGRLRPGENADALVRLAVPRNDLGGAQRLGLVFRSRDGHAVEPQVRELEILPRPAPRLVASLEPVIVLPPADPDAALLAAVAGAATEQAAQRARGADDAPTAAASGPRAPRLAPLVVPTRPRLHTEAPLTLRAHVRNVGPGDALGATLELDAPHPALQVPEGPLALGDLLPGESASVEFEVRLTEPLRGATVPLLVSLSESGLGVRAWQDLGLPLDRELPALPGTLDPPVLLTVRDEGLLARMAGLPARTHLPAFEVLGDRWRVELPDGRSGWVDDATVALLPAPQTPRSPAPGTDASAARDTRAPEPQAPRTPAPGTRESPPRDTPPPADARPAEAAAPVAAPPAAPAAPAAPAPPTPAVAAPRPGPASPRPPPPDVGEQLVFVGPAGPLPDDRPPVLTLEQPLPRRTAAEHLRVALRAHDDHELLELAVRLNGREPRAELGDLRGERAAPTARRLVARLALRPGLNRVELVARDAGNPEHVVEHVVYRDAALADPWLLVIAVERPADPALPAAPGAHADALALGEALARELRVPPAQQLALIGAEARHAALAATFEHLAARMDPDDTLLVLFAGHATARPARDGPELALLPHDAPADLASAELWTAPQLAALLDTLPDVRATLLLDAGFAAGAARGVGPGLPPDAAEQACAPLLARPGRLLLAPVDLARGAPAPGGHGALFPALTALLDGAGDVDADGRTTLREALVPLRARLAERAPGLAPVLHGDPRDDAALSRPRPR